MNTKEKWLAALVVFIIVFAALKATEAPPKPLSPEQVAQQKAQDSLQAEYDQQKRILKDIRYMVKGHIKKNLKDPGSFEEIEHDEFEVTKKSKKIYYQAFLKYRAKNSFGGYEIEKWCFNFNQQLENTDVFKCE